ncbi:MAG: hypothetical protein JRF72_09800 [Deltaproteobacteria bacterium]|jgi:hypothetical protein|nr:hypothetical protein [Deltaproteobacteria bacterium]
MLTSEQKHYMLTRAYVPEHTVNLITYLSGGEPFLIDDFFVCRTKDWVILIGFPFEAEIDTTGLERVIDRIKKRFNPEHLSLIAPELPASICNDCLEIDSDHYYTLEAKPPVIRSVVRRNLKKARQALRIERASSMGQPHRGLMDEFTQRVHPPARVQNMISKLPGYVEECESAMVLNAWDRRNNLAAFYIIDLAAADFTNYIIGCYSKTNYVLGASDLLLDELIQLGIEFKKRYIHLGLGVNEGIRRFKTKWGARPTRQYEMCELRLRKPSLIKTILSLPKFG